MNAKRTTLGIRSIVWKLFFQVAGIILTVLAAVWLLNSFVLKEYYLKEKQQAVVAGFTAADSADSDGALRDVLLQIQDTDGINAVLWQGQTLLYSTFNTDRFMLPPRVDYARGTYEMTVTQEDRLSPDSDDAQAILLVGTLQSGYHLYLRSPVAAIGESVAVTNRFLLLAGGAALVLGLLLVIVVANRYARPIRDLADVADRVAQLDFGGRYAGRAQDEIGALGRSINEMSLALETIVTQLKNANAALMADNAAKQKQDAARRAFIANVSHELKTPVALIGTYAEGLREDIAAGGDNKDYYCTVIEDEAHRIAQMLRRMTMLMQLESGGEQLEIERFDVAALLRELLLRRRPACDERQVTLHLPPDEPVYVWGDPFLIEDVLENYISNACNHVPEGGAITAVTVPRDGRMRVILHNTGAPIPEEDLPRIWDSFYKVDKARTRAYGGSGIGLSVVAAVMQAHGMPYGVQNTEAGVAFYIELETR